MTDSPLCAGGLQITDDFEAESTSIENLSDTLFLVKWCFDRVQRKTKGQQLKGKIVSALFHTFWHFSTHFLTLFPKISSRTFFLRIKGFDYCFSSKRRKENK